MGCRLRKCGDRCCFRLQAQEADRIRLKKELDEAHQYTIIKVATSADMKEQIGRDVFFDLVDFSKVHCLLMHGANVPDAQHCTRLALHYCIQCNPLGCSNSSGAAAACSSNARCLQLCSRLMVADWKGV